MTVLPDVEESIEIRYWRVACDEAGVGIGDVELSNNLSEQMMRRIKMNLNNACNVGGEISAKHNAFMFSVIESCKMIKRNVEDYLKSLFRRLRTAKNGEDLTCCLPCYMSF